MMSSRLSAAIFQKLRVLSCAQCCMNCRTFTTVADKKFHCLMNTRNNCQKIAGHYAWWQSAARYDRNGLRLLSTVECQPKPASDETQENDNCRPSLWQNLSPEEERKLKILQLEYDVWESLGKRVPSNVTDKMWLEILKECPTTSSRQKLFKFWFKREKVREAALRKKEARKKEMELTQPKSDIDSEDFPNRFIQKYTKSKMNEQLYSQNLAFSMVHGPHLVFDLGFQEHMGKREMNNLVEQLLTSHGFNHLQKEPFHFHFCNTKPDSAMSETLYRRFTGLENILYTVCETSYLDSYPKESLVYLSPNAPSIMTEFDHNDVYIVGGIVDKSGQEPLTFAKAKREGIRCMKLPLDKYLQWSIGSKALTLDQMVKILCTLKHTKSDWMEAFKHVPKRKFQWR